MRGQARLLKLPKPTASKRLAEVLNDVREYSNAGGVTGFVLIATLDEGRIMFRHSHDGARSSLTELIGVAEQLKHWLLQQLDEANS